MLSDGLELLPYPKRVSTLLRMLREQDDLLARIAELNAFFFTAVQRQRAIAVISVMR